MSDFREHLNRLLEDPEFAETYRQEKISEIQERCDAAAPGPWTVMISEGFCDADIETDCPQNKTYEDEECKSCAYWKCSIPAFVPEPLVLDNGEYDGLDDTNAEFIAHAREDIPFLLSEVARLKSEACDLNTKIDALKPYYELASKVIQEQM